MMRKFIYGILLAICTYSNALCFDDKLTHPQITEKAANNSNLGTYLINNLGFSNGLDTKFPSNSKNRAVDLLKDGSTDEDTTPTPCRASNHFHNPTKPWTDAGLSGDQGWQAKLVDADCFSTGYNLKLSNIIWGTGFESPTGPKTSTINTRDWGSTRFFYLNALTSASSTERESYYALTFYSLGHVMHLLQDMAVPAHVRNDFKSHFYKRRDSSFVDISKPSTYTANPFEDYMKGNGGLITGIAPIYDIKNVPVTRFWDTDTYNGYSTSIQTVGLSEYTNANFFSENTIFAENKDPNDVRYFAHPAKNETDANHIEEIVAKDNKIDKRRYVYKPDTGINVAAYGYFNKTLANSQNSIYWPSDISEGLNYTLDDDIYKGYAAVLMPTVIGYSAGLLNYFFRGEMDMEKDPENPGQYIIKNKTGEIMSGTFTLYYDYEEGTEITRKAVERWVLTEENGKAIRAKDKSEPLSLILPIDPAPKEQGKYILVFQGKLGNEDDAVVGKTINLNRFFEDWEYGYNGRYQWRVTRGNDISMYPIVDGFDGHESKVLETYSAGPIGMPQLPAPIPLTKEVSFDYYVPGAGGYCGNFSLWLSSSSGYNCGINLRQENCYGYGNVSMLFEFNKWVHVVVSKEKLPCTDMTGVQIGSSNGVLLYVDNISVE